MYDAFINKIVANDALSQLEVFVPAIRLSAFVDPSVCICLWCVCISFILKMFSRSLLRQAAPISARCVRPVLTHCQIRTRKRSRNSPLRLVRICRVVCRVSCRVSYAGDGLHFITGESSRSDNG